MTCRIVVREASFSASSSRRARQRQAANRRVSLDMYRRADRCRFDIHRELKVMLKDGCGWELANTFDEGGREWRGLVVHKSSKRKHITSVK